MSFNEADRAIFEAFVETNQELHQEIVAAFEQSVYDWDGTITYRANGQIVDSPRDIKDTGELQESQQAPEIRVSQGEILGEHVNTADHAHDVYFGYETDSGKSKPGRDWIGEALTNINLEDRMAENLRNRLL